MAPGSGSDDDGRRPIQDRAENSTGDAPNSSRQDNPFVRFRNNVDNFAASVFADFTEAFPSLQKYVPPPNKSFFDDWAREAFRRFNDRYERSTNPERKGIERMSCYDDKTKSQEGNDLRNMGRRWEDHRKEISLPQDSQQAVNSSPSATPNVPRANIGDLLDILGLPTPGHLTRWTPSREYLHYSPYSPLQLEEDTLTSAHGALWREAFEELLCAEHDQPLRYTDKEDFRSLKLPKEAWIDSLSNRRLVEPTRNGHFLLDILGLPSSDDHGNEEYEGNQGLSDEESAKRSSPQRRDIERFSTGTNDLITSFRHVNEEERTEEEGKPSWTRCPGLLELAADEEEEASDEDYEVSGFQEDDEEKQASFVPGVISSHTTRTTTQTLTLLDGTVQKTRTYERHLPDGSKIQNQTTESRSPDGFETTEESTSVFNADGSLRCRTLVERVNKESMKPLSEQGNMVEKDKEDRSAILEAAKEHQKETEKKKGGWFWSK